MIYAFIAILFIYLVIRYDIRENPKNRLLYYKLMLIILILVSGLRYRLGMDTPIYLDYFYHNDIKIEDFSFVDILDLNMEPLFSILNSLVYYLGGKFYHIQLIQAILVNSLVFIYFRRHSNYIFLCAFIYYIWLFLGFNMEEMRSSISVVLCLFANDYILNKKWIKGGFLYFVGFLFHYATIFAVIVLFFLFLRLNFKGIIILLLSFIIGGYLHFLLEDYLTLLEFSGSVSNKVSYYIENDSYTIQSGNVNYFIVYILPLLIYPFISLYYVKKHCRNNRILQFEPFVMIGLICVIMQFYIPLFYRFEHFFSIYFILYISQSFIEIVRNKIKRMSIGLGCSYALSLFLPFLMYIGMTYSNSYIRYVPYTSIFEKKTYLKRENIYSEKNRPAANLREY